MRHAATGKRSLRNAANKKEWALRAVCGEDRFDYRAGDTDRGAVTLVIDLAEALERVGLPVVWAWSDAFQFSQDDFACAVHGYCVQIEGCVAEPLQSITAILPGW